jgi:conjugative transfer signal peptidase TraF
LGVYSIQRSADIARNDLVAVCLPEPVAALGHARGYLSAGSCSSGTIPVLKQVIAVAGDVVDLQRDFLAVNGRVVDDSPRHSTDKVGRPLEPLACGHRLVGDGDVWVLGIRRERSWDSRYFGPVPVASIVAIARPLMTLSRGDPE